MQHLHMPLTLVLVILAFILSPVGATEEPQLCTPESTDMVIDYGDHVVCEIDEVRDEDTFRFAGTTDELIIIKALQISNIEPCIELQDPDGLMTFGCDNAAQNQIQIRLDKTGVYTIVLSDRSHDERGRYRLLIDRITPPSATTPVFLLGERESLRESEIQFAGDFDLWTFEGTRDDVISLIAQGFGPEAMGVDHTLRLKING